jgi:hypothetical protein
MPSSMELANHLVQLLLGIGAGAFLLFFFHALGLSLTPASESRSSAFRPHAVTMGAVTATLFFWYCVKQNMALQTAKPVGICIVVVLIGLRLPFITRRIFQEADALRFALGQFAFFYSIAYLMLPPPLSSDFLPIWVWNNDILNYINHARFIDRLGPSNIASYDYIPIYGLIPSVLYLISALSSFFGDEAMRASMPALFTVVAAIGCAFSQLARTAFGLPRQLASLIAAILISGPFFQLIVKSYYLSQLVAIALVLVLLNETAKALKDDRYDSFRTMLWVNVPCYVLLAFTYVSLLLIGLGLQLGLIVVFRVLATDAIRRKNLYPTLVSALRWSAASILGLATALLLDLDHFITNLQFFALISKVIAGWPLDYISPFAAVGLPINIQVSNRSIQFLESAGYTGVLIGLGWWLAKVKRIETLVGRALVTLATLSIIIYFLYFQWVGPSYQQWKLASFLVLPMSIAMWGAAMKVIHCAFATVPNRRRVRVGLVGASVLLLVNMTNQSSEIQLESSVAPLQKFSFEYKHLKLIDALAGGKELFVHMKTYASNFFAPYFIPNKMLYLLTPSYYPHTAIRSEDVSQTKPLFVEGDSCQSGPTKMAVASLGCLYFEWPSLQLNTVYRFNEDLPYWINATGLSVLEPWGRWTDGKRATLYLVAKKEDVGSDLFLNFELIPFLPPALKHQTVIIRWGRDNEARVDLAEHGWVSLTLSTHDWSRPDAVGVLVEFYLPDAVSPHSIDRSSNDRRILGVGFIAMSLTKGPEGKIGVQKH